MKSTGPVVTGVPAQVLPEASTVVAELLRMAVVSPWWQTVGFTPPVLPIMGLKSQDYDSLTSWERFIDYLRHIVLPVACLTYGGLAYISRQMRAGMLEVIRQDYIRTAEAKGCSKPRVEPASSILSAQVPSRPISG